MMWIFGIVLISGMKALLCKGFSLGGFLLLFWIKACKWHTKERDYLLRRYREIPDTILERQKQETEEIEKSE